LDIRLLTGKFWPIRFDVTIETIVSIVTSKLVGQNLAVNCRLSACNHQNFFIQLGAEFISRKKELFSWKLQILHNYAFSIFSSFFFSVIRPGREPMFQRKPEEEPQIRATQASAAAQAPRARSPGLSQRSEGVGSRRVESPVSHKSESLRTQSPVDKSR